MKFIEVTVTSRIPYKGPYVVKSQLVEQNDPFLINEIACILQYRTDGIFKLFQNLGNGINFSNSTVLLSKKGLTMPLTVAQNKDR